MECSSNGHLAISTKTYSVKRRIKINLLVIGAFVPPPLVGRQEGRGCEGVDVGELGLLCCAGGVALNGVSSHLAWTMVGVSAGLLLVSEDEPRLERQGAGCRTRGRDGMKEGRGETGR